MRVRAVARVFVYVGVEKEEFVCWQRSRGCGGVGLSWAVLCWEWRERNGGSEGESDEIMEGSQEWESGQQSSFY